MEQFRQKNTEEIREQISDTSESLGTDIAPESLLQELIGLSNEEIKIKYPERYQIYIKLLRAIKNRQSIDTVELMEMRTWINALNNLDTYIDKHSHLYENFEARDKKQFDVFEDIRNSLEQGHKEGYVKLPTGVGKTVLFSRVVESLGLKTLIVVPSKILVGQTGERLEEFTNVQFGKFFQGEKDLSENITITTYASLIKGINNGTIDPNEYPVLILDEAHKALGEETGKAVRQFNGVKLGFTATPQFSSEKHISNLLKHEIHTMSTIEAVKEGLISRFRSYIAYTDVDLSGVEIRNGEKYDEEQLDKAINLQTRNQAAVELYKHTFDGSLAIAYCSSVSHATNVAKEFNGAGILAEVISGETKDVDRATILDKFSKGEIKVLCNAKVLIEGFDEPKASLCLNLHPTLSLIQAEQRAGRVLRLDPESPNKWAHIVDFVDRSPRIAPYTFSEVTGASEASQEAEVSLHHDTENPGNTIGTKHDDRPSDINITGLRVVVNAHEVLMISKQFEIERNSSKVEFLSLDQLKDELKRLNITSSSRYNRERKEHPNWPSRPSKIYKTSGWVSWFDLFGKV